MPKNSGCRGYFFILKFSFCIAVTGCAGPTINPSFKMYPERIRSIRTVPARFQVREVGFETVDLFIGGYQATRPQAGGTLLSEDTRLAARVMANVIVEEFEDLGYEPLRPFSKMESDADPRLRSWINELWEKVMSMERAFKRSGGKAFPPERGIGPVSPPPAGRKPSDAVLFIYGSGQVESAQQRVLGGVFTGANKNVIQLAAVLIDSVHGDLMWRFDIVSPGANASRDWQLRSAVREALSGIPDIHLK